MWFSLFTTVLILAVTFYQGLQGLFSGLINCILAVISAAVAFGFYENVYFGFLADRQPDFGRAIALLGIFIVTLLVLRTIFDILIKGNVQFPVYVDRVGGGLFGVITALIIVGMLSIGFQMLPFPPDFMGFSRYSMVNKDTNETIPWPSSSKKEGEGGTGVALDYSKIEMRRQNTWLGSGRFAAALASHLSSNALRGQDEVTFSEVHPDFVAEIFHAKANALGFSRLTAKQSSLDVLGYWDVPSGGMYLREFKEQNGKQVVRLTKPDPLESGFKEWVIRVRVQDAKDEGADVVRFTPDQVRLFGRNAPGRTMKAYTLQGINDDTPAAQNKLVLVYPGEPIARNDNSEMDFVFRVSDNAEWTPVYIEFKQDARAEITSAHDHSKDPLPPIGSKTRKPKPQRGCRTDVPRNARWDA